MSDLTISQDQRITNRERALIHKFIATYCRLNHGVRKDLCSSCVNLLNYALERLDVCPYNPKPPCKRCLTHCYEPQMRTRIKQIMRFSGMYFVRRGRLNWLVKYFLINKTLSRKQLKAFKRRLPSNVRVFAPATQMVEHNQAKPDRP